MTRPEDQFHDSTGEPTPRALDYGSITERVVDAETIEGDIIPLPEPFEHSLRPSLSEEEVEALVDAAGLEDQSAFDEIDETTLEFFDPTEVLERGASISLAKRALALTRIAEHYDAYDRLHQQRKDAESFKPNDFNTKHSRSEMKTIIDDAELALDQAAERYKKSYSYLAGIKKLRKAGFDGDDLSVLSAEKVRTRDEIEKLRHGGELAKKRWEVINAIRNNAGLDSYDDIASDAVENEPSLNVVPEKTSEPDPDISDELQRRIDQYEKLLESKAESLRGDYPWARNELAKKGIYDPEDPNHR